MTIKLNPVRDFLSVHTEMLLEKARLGIVITGGVMPVLSYVKHGHEFSIPMDYEMMLQIGSEMKVFSSAAAYIGVMGPEFGFLAVQLAERAIADPLNTSIDYPRFLQDVGHILNRTAPEAFFLSIPVQLKRGNFNMRDLNRALESFDIHPERADAIVVVGRNPIKSYAMLMPFKTGQTKAQDSFGVISEEGGLFASIYAPSTN